MFFVISEPGRHPTTSVQYSLNLLFYIPLISNGIIRLFFRKSIIFNTPSSGDRRTISMKMFTSKGNIYKCFPVEKSLWRHRRPRFWLHLLHEFYKVFVYIIRLYKSRRGQYKTPPHKTRRCYIIWFLWLKHDSRTICV